MYYLYACTVFIYQNIPRLMTVEITQSCAQVFFISEYMNVFIYLVYCSTMTRLAIGRVAYGLNRAD